MLASRYGHNSTVECLLLAQADVNRQNKVNGSFAEWKLRCFEGWLEQMQWESTAKQNASTRKHFGIAEKLLEQGADADMETPVD
jgi:ankyrin repeat protein